MAKKKKIYTRSDFNHIGSLITYQEPGNTNETCLGDLMPFSGHGVYDPSLGRVDVTEEEAKAHNTALSNARIKSMDEHCEIGQGGFAYLKKTAAGYEVHDFIGTIINTGVVHVTVRTILFNRKGKTYKGFRSTGKNAGDNFNFKRVS